MILAILLCLFFFLLGFVIHGFRFYHILSWFNIYMITTLGAYGNIGDILKSGDGRFYTVFDVIPNTNSLCTVVCYQEPAFKYKPLNEIIIKIIKINYKLRTQK